MPVKMVRRLSNLSTLRGGVPTSPGVAYNFTNFRFNHLSQRGMPNPISPYKGSRTTNSTGAPYTAGVGQALGGEGMQGPRNDPGAVKVE